MEQIVTKTTFQQENIGWKGSRLRCLLLSGLERNQLQSLLISIIDQKNPGNIEIDFTEDFDYFPKGLINPTEVELDKEKRLFRSGEPGIALNKWWLEKNARTPVWDFACNAKIFGTPGLILVEAKAHRNELYKVKDASGAKTGSPNRNRIEEALSIINEKYKLKLSADKYFQLSNRIAWCIKLASLGIPVVLIYLGCLRSEEMKISKNDTILESANQWDEIVTTYSKHISFYNWEQSVSGERLLDDTDRREPKCFYPIIRSIDIQLHLSEQELNTKYEV